MKKIIALILTIATLAVGLMGGCANTISEEDKQNALIIEVHSAGYGTNWIDFMAKEFQKDTGTKVIVNYQVGTQGISNMSANIQSLTSDTDLFFMGGASFTEVYRGQVTIDGVKYPCIFEDLSDLYASTIEGEGVTVLEKMDEVSKQELEIDGIFI